MPILFRNCSLHDAQTGCTKRFEVRGGTFTPELASIHSLAHLSTMGTCVTVSSTQRMVAHGRVSLYHLHPRVMVQLED